MRYVVRVEITLLTQSSWRCYTEHYMAANYGVITYEQQSSWYEFSFNKNPIKMF